MGIEMRGIRGISITVGTLEHGLWFDHDRRAYQPKGVGIKLDFALGRWIRPIPKFWKKGFWKGGFYNPWKGAEYWFVLRTIPLPAFFLSIAFLRYGFYVGWKPYYINEPDSVWASEREMFTWALCPSVTFRKTRWR
jgi:hypothetical protein